ncbi:MAG: hypothetical protein KGK10_02830 [Rhodospirillales bacterium]|nr:hypothetical protein [Rhodospirillales bacterium]
MITLQDFQRTGFIVGSAVGNPPEQTYGTTDPHHRVHKTYYFGSVVKPAQFPGLQKLEIIGGNDTVYLPYYQSQVASIRLEANCPGFFVTDNLSGCGFYIGQRTDGELVVFHANSQKGSAKAVMAGRPPSFQTEAAAAELDQLVQDAIKHHSGSVRIVGGVSKSSYLSGIDRLAATGDDFLGGTTVAGWRNGGSWEFWYQNWGSVKGGAVGLLSVKKFYG